MKTPKHTEQAAMVLARLAGWGFPPGVQQRLGALAVTWNVFEASLEKALWMLSGEDVKGNVPSTDKTSIGEWIKRLGKPWPQFECEANDVLETASLASHDLMEYRHAIMHGWMIPAPDMPTFIRNPGWNGELRRRPSHDAHVDENLLDMAIDSGWTLCRVIHVTQITSLDPSKVKHLVELRDEVFRARLSASELRHLTAAMNHEKY